MPAGAIGAAGAFFAVNSLLEASGTRPIDAGAGMPEDTTCWESDRPDAKASGQGGKRRDLSVLQLQR